MTFVSVHLHKNGNLKKEKGRDLAQSYDKSPYTHRKKKQKKQRNNTKMPPKFR